MIRLAIMIVVFLTDRGNYTDFPDLYLKLQLTGSFCSMQPVLKNPKELLLRYIHLRVTGALTGKRHLPIMSTISIIRPQS